MPLKELLNNKSVSRRAAANDNLEVATLFSSYANTDGGIVLFGVKENGKLVGVSPQNLIEDIKYALLESGMADIVWEYEQLIEGRHLLIAVSISKSMNKLYIQNGRIKEYYCRICDKIIIANKIIMKVWSLKDGRSEFKKLNELESEIKRLIQENQMISLAFLYKSLSEKNSTTELALSQLILKNEVQIICKNDELKYSQVIFK